MSVRVLVGLASLASLCLLAGTVPAQAAGAPGSLDTTFGSGGIAESSAVPGATDVILQSNGDILVSAEGTGDFTILRFLPSGQLDTSFGSGGIAQAAFSGDSATASQLALGPSGTIIAVGSAAPTSGGDSEWAVARFTSSGSLDSTFGTGGTVLTDPLPATTTMTAATAVVVQPAGQILVAGMGATSTHTGFDFFGAMVRYTTSGSLDSTFGSGGIVSGDGLTQINALGLDSSGDIFVLPEFDEFTSAGVQDASATTTAITASSQGGLDTFQPNGQPLIAETVGVSKHVTDVEVQRFSAGGTLDSTFSDTPFPWSSTSAEDSVNAVAVAPGGQIAVGGSQFHSDSVIGVGLLNSSGSLDTSFGPGGTVTTDINGSDGVTDLVVQSNGDIVAAGTTENSSGDSLLFVARYLG